MGFAGVGGTAESGEATTMDFRKLCSALRLLETQGGDARIADAQIIALLLERAPDVFRRFRPAAAVAIAVTSIDIAGQCPCRSMRHLLAAFSLL